MNKDSPLASALELAWGTLKDWAAELSSLLPNFLVALLVLLLFLPLARLVRSGAKRLTARTSDSPALQGLAGQMAFLGMLALGVVIALNVLHLDKTVTSLLAGAGIIGIALGFAFQDISANFIAGVFMAFRRPISVGDIIETNGYTGKVEHIDLRTTRIETFQGLHVLIPNNRVFQEPLTNFTLTARRRIDLAVGVSYGDNLRKVERVARACMEDMDLRLPDEDVQINFSGYGDSSIELLVMFWIHYPGQPGYLEARSEAVMRLKEAFDANGITIPFPIRTLDLGIKGGTRLSQEPLQVALNGDR